MRILFVALCCILFSCFCQAQTPSLSNDNIVIENILIAGNKRTKNHIIKRELLFNESDTIKVTDTSAVFQQSHNNIFNTNLFNEVTITFIPSSYDSLRGDVLVEVVERWYFFISPQIDIADRNFNEWIERGAKFSRLVYGINMKYTNFRGRKEELEVAIHGGFVEKYELFYTIPYLTKNQKTGIKFQFHYSLNKNVAARNLDNKLDYIESDFVLRKRFYTGANFLLRRNYYTKHNLEVLFHDNSIKDTIAEVNPDYFLNGNTKEKLFELSYTLTYDKRNRNNYPTKGSFISGTVKKLGLTIWDEVDIWRFIVNSKKFFEIGKKASFGASLNYYYNNQSPWPFMFNEGLGYHENFVRGYELYVINANQYALNRNELRYELISFNIDISKYLKMHQFNKIPYGIFIKTFFDHGYSTDATQNVLNARLSNKYLYSYGVGIDVVSFYNLVFRFEIARNNLNENGFFFHMGSAI